MKTIRLAVLAMSFYLAACSSGGGSGDNKAPTDRVNSKISGSGSKALTGQTAVFEASQALSKQKGSQPAQILRNVADKLSSNDSPSALAVKFKTSQLQRSLSTQQCSIAIKQGSNSSSSTGGAGPNLSPVSLKVSGGSCPIEITMDVTMIGADGKSPCADAGSAGGCQFTTQLKMTYQVKDEKLAEQLEVRSGQMAMKFDIDQTMPNGQTAEMTMDMKSKSSFDFKTVDLSGQVHLISGKQDVNFKMIMPQGAPGTVSEPQIAGGAKEDLQYFEQSSGVSSSLSAVVIFSGNSPDEKYFVDGVPVTAKAYMDERNKFANSAMKISQQSENPQQGPSEDGSSIEQPQQPIDFPAPNPRPTPGPTPAPMPSPRPQPAPPLPSEQGKWACVAKDYSNDDLFIGYGPVEFAAKSKARQACQNSRANASCETTPKCEQQEAVREAWFCEVKHYSTGQIFNSSGASQLEASYLARKTCILSNPGTANNCSTATANSCVHQ